MILIADTKVAAVGRPDTDTPDIGTQEMLMLDDTSRSRWPVLLALQAAGSELVKPAADLLRTALRSRWGWIAADVIGRWLDQAQSDSAALAAVEGFLPRLIVERSDQAMLMSLVDRRLRAWADPLKPEVADRLNAVITGAPVVIRRRERV